MGAGHIFFAAAGGRNYSAQELLRQRHIIAALKAIGQALLCFTDPLLLHVLERLPELPPGHHSVAAEPSMFALDQDRVIGEPGGAKELRPEAHLAISLAWAGLLGAANVFELQPLIDAISRQLQQNDAARGFATLPNWRDVDHYKPFALKVYNDFANSRPHRPEHEAGDAADAMRTFGSPAEEAEFKGSEWQRPVRGSEVEFLLQIAYWSALWMDRLLQREPWVASCGLVPQTEWPRMFANWRWLVAVVLAILVSISW